GATRVAAMLDVARTTMRRAEREALVVVAADSEVGRYLNRLSDLLWVLARWQEGESLTARGSKEIADEDE
ncbi:MAG: ATP:cob(I)alamin adenosyltransferase, partial [Acidimicrobiia bacterium]